jgi:hypothetical protein
MLIFILSFLIKIFNQTKIVLNDINTLKMFKFFLKKLNEST